jgi:serine/threonine protein kinase
VETQESQAMAAHPGTHPSPDLLQAYGLGKLDETRLQEVESHLDSCPACLREVLAVSDDGFLQRFRAARGPGGTPVPDKPLSGVARSLYATDPGRVDQPPLTGLPTTQPPADLPPELVNNAQYEILRELGRGGMGVVYLATNKLMNRPEVLKVMNKGMLDRAGGKERFLREIQSAARLSHPNVVTAHSALELGELLVFAMEYIDGEDLARFVSVRGPLPVANACYYAQQAALGLQHAFEKKMVHRDIKPQNLILSREGKKHLVKVLDFGLAKVLREKGEDVGLTGTGQVLGTPDYIAPEQIQDAARADIRADIYSLGCTLYHLLAGAPPFTGKSLYEKFQAHHTLEAQPLNLVRPEVPVELAAVVRKMMAKDPARRYQTPKEVAKALKPFIGHEAKGAPSELSLEAAETKAPKSVKTDPVVPVAAPPVEKKPVAMPREDRAEGRGPLRTDSRRSPAPARRESAPRKQRQGAPKSMVLKKRLIAVGLVAGLLLIVWLGVWAAGVIFKVKTANGIIVLTNVPDDAEVIVDDETKTVTLKDSDGKPIEISIVAGKKHLLQVKKQGFKIYTKELEIDAGDRQPITVRLEPLPGPLQPLPHRPDWVEEKWLRAVASLPADQQVAEVRSMLRLRNPNFDGTFKPQIENNMVTAIEINGAAVLDLSPLLAFSGLQQLDCSCPNPWQSPLADLSPLTRLPLRSLRYPYHTGLGAEQLQSIKTLQTINDQPVAAFWKRVEAEGEVFELFRQRVAGLTPDEQVKEVADRLKVRNPGFDGKLEPRIDNGAVVELAFPTDAVVDISPVRALPKLQRLDLRTYSGKGKLADLTPLQGVPLTCLRLGGCPQVRDLSQLQGMKLTELDIGGCVQVQDLTPLQGMPLESLCLNRCGQVRDLTPLHGMPLTYLDLCDCGQVLDLTPLHGMKLTVLILIRCHRAMRDLSLLQGMNLTQLDLGGCDQVQDLTPLKGMPLTWLSLGDCHQVRDLSPLQGMKLTVLFLNNCGQVRDLTPLQGMKLTNLSLNGCGQVRDLSPLQGMNLEQLYLNGCEQVQDLTLLKGMPLTRLTLDGCHQIQDLTPLQGMRLTLLALTNCSQVRDLTPLQGMPITWLNLHGCSLVQDLTPLQKMPLTWLNLPYCSQVRDLTPLQGMPLTVLNLDGCRLVQDLTPLQGMPLKELILRDCDQVRDLTPLRDLPLEKFYFTPKNITKGIEVIRGMKSLKKIEAGQLFPAEEFWKKYDAGEFNAATSAVPSPPNDKGQSPAPHRPGWVEEKWLREVAALPAEQQLAQVKTMLPLRNPGFDGKLDPRIENGVVTEIRFDGTAVQDLSPLLVFADLHTLDCSCPNPWQSPLADLSPLTRLPLRSLRYPYHTWLGAEQLRSTKTLETINDRPAVAFWKQVEDEAKEFELFRQTVAVGLTPDEQVKAVANRLKERNPGFDGNLRNGIDNGTVVELTFPTDAVVDISPVRALPKLQRLNLNTQSFKGKLADLTLLQGMPLTSLDLVGCHQVRDLTPLQGMKLTHLQLAGCSQVRDLTPLHEMPLTELDLWACGQVRDFTPLQGMRLTKLILFGDQVQDLKPLQGMKLTHLRLHACGRVRDLTPLQGMPLTDLDLWGCGQVQDLTPLKGMKLTSLNLGWSQALRDLTLLQAMPLTNLDLPGCREVRDLTPLKGMKLTTLDLTESCVHDLAPLEGMPLKSLYLHGCAQVQDLTPLRALPLEAFSFTPKNITKGLDGIQRMKSLKMIGVHYSQLFPAEEFWKKYNAGEF